MGVDGFAFVPRAFDEEAGGGFGDAAFASVDEINEVFDCTGSNKAGVSPDAGKCVGGFADGEQGKCGVFGDAYAGVMEPWIHEVPKGDDGVGFVKSVPVEKVVAVEILFFEEWDAVGEGEVLLEAEEGGGEDAFDAEFVFGFHDEAEALVTAFQEAGEEEVG